MRWESWPNGAIRFGICNSKTAYLSCIWLVIDCRSTLAVSDTESFLGVSHIYSSFSMSLWVLEWFSIVPFASSDRLNLKTMLGGSSAVILKRYTEYAVVGLLSVVVIQGFGYGLIFDLNFFLRNLSVIGGLFMVFSDSMITRNQRFAGIPTISETDRKK